MFWCKSSFPLVKNYRVGQLGLKIYSSLQQNNEATILLKTKNIEAYSLEGNEARHPQVFVLRQAKFSYPAICKLLNLEETLQNEQHIGGGQGNCFAEITTPKNSHNAMKDFCLEKCKQTGFLRASRHCEPNSTELHTGQVGLALYDPASSCSP